MYKIVCLTCNAYTWSNKLEHNNYDYNWRNDNNDKCFHECNIITDINMNQYKTDNVLALLKVWKKDQFKIESEVTPILADALQDANYDDEYILRILRTHHTYTDDTDNLAWLEELLGQVPKELIGDDWQQAFIVSMPPDPCPPALQMDCSPFCRSDVKNVLAFHVGEHDSDNWWCSGELYDGRWFALRAGCCYTGWIVSSNGTSDVALDIMNIIQYGLEDTERDSSFFRAFGESLRE